MKWLISALLLFSFSANADIYLYSTVQAERYSSKSGVVNSGTVIGSFDNGDYLRYNKVGFGSSSNRMLFRVSAPFESAGMAIEIRIDGLTGPIIGKLIVQSTGGYGTYQNQIATISPTSGKHNVFLIARGGYGVANLDYFQVYKDTGSPAPAPSPTPTVTQAPSYLVKVNIPSSGAIVSGTTPVKGTAPGMKNVEVFNDAGTFLSRATIDSAGNFSADVDTTKLTNGVQNLRVIGWDSPAGTAFTNTNEYDVSVNVQNTLVQVPAGLPDLIVESLTTIPAQPIAGQPFYYQVKITNIGNAATPVGGIIGVAISTDLAQYIWYSNFVSLAAGASMTVVTNGGSAGLPTVTTTAGTHNVRANVNDANRFVESNMSNNISNFVINVASAPAPGPLAGPITFERVFNDPNMTLLRYKGGPFYPYSVYYGGDGRGTYPEGMAGFRWFGDEMEVYTTAEFTPAPYNPFKIANGYLTISAIPATNYPGSPKPYLSGYLETSKGPWWDSQAVRDARGGFEQKYGYWEIRARVPRSKGIWPAFWLMGGFQNGDSSQQGEIDIFEMIGDGKVYQTIHDWGPVHTTNSKIVSPGFDPSTGFHTYGLLWSPNEIVWYIDGVETFRADQTKVATFRDRIGPLYVVMNVAVGGSWPGAPDATTKFPANFDIEYLRVRALP
jgi:beta-glucanase (GH16 family)